MFLAKPFAVTKKNFTFALQKPKNPALWCNGSTSDSGSASEGSNPSKATKRGCAVAQPRFKLLARGAV